MEGRSLAAVALLAGFTAACGGVEVPDIEPYCQQTGPASYKVVEPGFPNDPLAALTDGSLTNYYTIEGRAKGSLAKNMVLSVDAEAEECSVTILGPQAAEVRRYPLKANP